MKPLTQQIKAVTLGLLLAGGLILAAPPSNPPGKSPPINTSSHTQLKQGTLILGTSQGLEAIEGLEAIASMSKLLVLGKVLVKNLFVYTYAVAGKFVVGSQAITNTTPAFEANTYLLSTSLKPGVNGNPPASAYPVRLCPDADGVIIVCPGQGQTGNGGGAASD